MPPSTTPGRLVPRGSSLAAQHGLCLRRQRLGSPSNLRSASRRCGFTRLPGSLLLRPIKLLTPCADLTGNFPAIGTFTSRLPSSRSTFSALYITTTVTGCLGREDSPPVDSLLALLATVA